jgi:hypothetical protein
MNAVRNDEVLLRYHPDRIGQHQLEQKPQRSDRERTVVTKGAQELVVVELIHDHLELAPYCRERLDEALYHICRALSVERRNLGMPIVRATE